MDRKNYITAQSQKCNKHLGLDNVVLSFKKGDILRIVSNETLLHIEDNSSNMKSYGIPFEIKVTSIYFDVAIESFEKEEMLEDFSFFD